MRIGIITFHFQNNYGAIMQTYALHHYLKKFGKPEIINYYNQAMLLDTSKQSVLEKIKCFLRPIKRFFYFSLRKKEKKFLNFRKKYITFSSKVYWGDEEISQNPPNYDIYITGSDQIWNGSLAGYSKAYFLNFTNSQYKYAFSSSVGHANMTKEEKKLAQKYLPSFAKIAVREQDTAKELSELLKRPIQTVLDPVFLLSKQEWEALANPVKLPKKGYIAVYALQDNEALHSALTYAETLGLPLIFINRKICGYNGIKIKTAGPREFLYILANASYVITNSFHGFAFSLIFKRQVFVCEYTTRNLRLVNLLEKIDAVNKQISSNTKDVASCQIDGKAAYPQLDVQCGRDFLADIFAKRKK